MSHDPGAARVALTGTVLLSALLLPSAALAQREPQGPPEGPAPDPAAFGPALSLPSDPALRKRLAAAEDYAREKSWPEVARALQALLDAREDRLLPVVAKGADGKEVTRWVSVRAEAERALRNLPPPGREQYELSCGQKAAALLNEAKEDRNPALYAAAAQRFLYTTAGAEALERLGAWHLDRGRYLMAARCFERLLSRDGPERVAPAVLFQAALALRRSGDPSGAERAWKHFTAKAPDGLRLGGRLIALSDLRRELDRNRPAAGGAADWAVFRGGPGRTAGAAGGPPAPDPRWQQDTLFEPAARSWLESAIKQHEGRSQAVLPALFPVASGGRLVCRTGRSIAAFDLKSGDLLWESDTLWGLDNLAEDSKLQAGVNPWAAFWLQSHPHALLENSTLGTLSTDGRRVYAVEDLAVPPQATVGFAGRRGFQAPEPPPVPALAEAANHNRLRAIDLATGKVVWEVGGKSGEKDQDAGLKDSFFLGPPLPLGGRLYALIDRTQELRLVCLDPAAGTLVWSQTLALANTKVSQDPARRIHAAPLACAEGILVCPTNAGGVFAVDLLSHGFLWAHAYREPPPPPPPPPPGLARRRPFRRPLAPVEIVSEWKAPAPVVQGGKVLIAPPDAPVLHCLSLRDGRLLWKEDRAADDLYLAGAFGGRVLLVGKQACRALSLADGKLLWRVDTGQPSGHGAAAGGIYYLPVRHDAEAKGPAVLAIDLEKGKVASRVAVAGKEPPGNLLFHEGRVVSQTLDAVTVFPQAKK